MNKKDIIEEPGQCLCKHGLTRRGFLTTVGVGAVSAIVASGKISAAEENVPEATAEKVMVEKMVAVNLLVNDQHHRMLIEPRWSLLHVLREHLELTGTKVGCERGECGACTVLIDDVPRYACLTLAVEAEGKKITTIEGLMQGEDPGPVQQAFIEEDAMQCGYCTPGQIMSIEGLLRANSQPSTEEIRMAVSGNICRCGTYAHIVKAAGRAASLKQS